MRSFNMLGMECHNLIPTKTFVQEEQDRFQQESDMQILRFWSQLTQAEQESLLAQLQHLDWDLLHQQKQLLKTPSAAKALIEPFTDFEFAGSLENQVRGKQLISEGRMGCLVLAGGQGTRLRMNGPKGCFPVSVIKHKSLFQLCAEKVLAAGKQAGMLLELAIMTSPENDAATKQYFAEHHFFGLNPKQVSFFCQGTLPFLDAQGHLFLESPAVIAEGPSGNGNCLHDFYASGIWHKWSQQGIDSINVILIDNPLADPFDAELLGFHTNHGLDISIKCTEKRHAQEKVGVVVKEGGRCQVIEYSEMPDQEKTALQADGKLKHRCANLSLFCFSMDFVQQIATSSSPLPLHKAWKAAKFVNEEGQTVLSSSPMAWKFEMFIFDLLRYTERVAALLYPREECFAPLKNASGDDSLESVQDALQKRDRQIFKEIVGLEPPTTPFELDASFYYPLPSLLEKWKGRMPNSAYVEP